MKFSESILASHAAVLGKTGSGKTSTAKLLIEQVVAAGQRVCILDPIKSDWWGLTSSSDGKRAGLPFHVLGGPHGHVPLHESAGKAIGEVVASGSLPLSIIDMADFKMGGLQKFFTSFAEALLKRNRGNLYLVLEEAHEFCPKERSGVEGENMGMFWAKKLATAGRSKGLRLIVLTQRTQALHNALLGSCETMIVHRMTAPADQKPATDWLKANAEKSIAAEVSGSISSLKTGEGWICSGESQLFERVQFPRIKTYDNTSGRGDGKPVKTAAMDTESLRSIIGDAIEEAKANDPVELRKRIAELEKAAKQAPAPTVDQGAIDRAVQQAVLAEQNYYKAEIAKLHRAVELSTQGVDARFAKISQVASQLAELAVPPPIQEIAVEFRSTNGVHKNGNNLHPKPTMPSQPKAAKAVGKSVQNYSGATGVLPTGENAILTAVAMYPDGVDREQLSILTGYKRSSRDAYIQRLSGKGLIDVGRTITATDAGMESLGDGFEPLPTGDALFDYWRSRLPAGELAVLEAVAESYPNAADRDSISDATGYKRSSRDAYIQRLKARKLVTVESYGVTASAMLFD